MAEKHTHTPGPWIIRESATHVTVIGADNEALFHDDKRIPRVLEDARLIAAAPDLLSLLDRLYNHVAVAEGKMRTERKTLQADLGYGTLGEISDAVDAVLAKARGRA